MRGETLTVEPQRWQHQGFAELDFDGRKLVVWEGIPGESSRVTVRHEGQNRIRSEWQGPAGAPHPSRRKPPCERYRTCGSCPLMHMDGDGQRDARLRIVHDSLDEFGLAEHTPDSVVPSPDGDVDYRHVVKLAVGMSDRGNIRIGAFRRGSHDIIAIPDCTVATPQLRQAMRVVARAVIDLDIHAWSPEHGGTLRYIILRQSRTTGMVLCTLVVGRSTRFLETLAARVMSVESGIVGVHMHVNRDPGNAIFNAAGDPMGPGFTRVEGERTIVEELAGVKLEIGPGDFFQANPGMAERIAHDIVAAFAPWEDRPAVDLYCGVGAFSLPLAKAHGWLLGVEVGEGAVARARTNAVRNHLQAEFLAGEVADRLPEIVARVADKAPVVLVDPARRGLEEGALERIVELKPAVVGYLSCNPRSLSRDLRQFVDAGWTVDFVRAYDMFPQTPHVETFALLRPPEAPEPAGRAPQRRIVSRGGGGHRG